MAAKRAKRSPPKNLGYHWDQVEPVVRADGKRPCRWCKGPVRPPKKRWCGSEACVWEWQRRTDFSLTRQAVATRDRYVCGSCGQDCERLDLGLVSYNAWLAGTWEQRRGDRAWLAKVNPRPILGPDGLPYSPAFWRREHERAVAWRVEHGISPQRHAWEVDHIVPVSVGGDWFDLGNLQVLCRPCHARKTAAFNRSRATGRRKRAG
jgi:hypothetical protein